MIFEEEFAEIGFDGILAVSASDITDEMIDKCFEIDRKFYKEEYSWENSEIKQIIKKFGHFCFVFLDKEEKSVMGYSFWIPVKTDVLNEFIKTKQMLILLKEEYCEEFKPNCNINLFCGGEAFVPGYDLQNLHNAIENLFQRKVLELANIGSRVEYIAIEVCCKYDEEYLIPLLGLEKSIKKDKSLFYYGKYSPTKIYPDSRYVHEIQKFYQDK